MSSPAFEPLTFVKSNVVVALLENELQLRSQGRPSNSNRDPWGPSQPCFAPGVSFIFGWSFMSKESAIALGRLKATFRRQPLPDKFSRLVSLLLDHLNRDTFICWPSRGRLAELMGCSEKTVQRNLRAVRELGLFDMETIGADEMRRRVGSKIRVTDRHTYTIYRLNSNQPLWKGNDLSKAMEIIKTATWRGVEERCRNQQLETAHRNDEEQWAGTLPTLPNVDGEGRYCPHLRKTVASLSNGDDTDSGTFSLQNIAPSTRTFCNDQSVPTHRPENSLAGSCCATPG